MASFCGRWETRQIVDSHAWSSKKARNSASFQEGSKDSGSPCASSEECGGKSGTWPCFLIPWPRLHEHGWQFVANLHPPTGGERAWQLSGQKVNHFKAFWVTVARCFRLSVLGFVMFCLSFQNGAADGSPCTREAARQAWFQTPGLTCVVQPRTRTTPNTTFYNPKHAPKFHVCF